MTVHRAQRPRRYQSELREAQARSTRRSIVAAATRLFTEDGYGLTSMDDVAREAGVSRATVFAAFGDKARLLKAAYDVALVGDDEPLALKDRPIAKSVRAERDPEGFIDNFARMCVDIGTRLPPIYEAVRGAATADPDARPIWDTIRQERSLGARHFVEMLSERAALRAGLTKEVASDIVFAMTEPGLYQLLVNERRWPPERLETWLAATLKAQLLRTPAARSRQGSRARGRRLGGGSV